MIHLNELCCECLRNVEKRVSNGGKISTETRKMLKHTATEVVEATEAYTEFCLSVKDTFCLVDQKNKFASELADIVCCCMIIAAKEDIDLEQAIIDCMEKNRKRADGTGDKL